MVGFVVQNHDVLETHQVRHDALYHLPFGFQGVDRSTVAAFEKRPATFRDFQPLAQLECVIVGNDDLRPLDIVQHVRRHQFTVGIVAVGIARQEDPKPVFDGEAGRDYKKTASKMRAAGTTNRIDGLPGDKHGHHRRLAGACGEFKGNAGQLRIRLGIRIGQMLQKLLPRRALRRNLGQPNCGFSGLDLTKEGPDALELMVSPMLEEPRRLRSD